MCSDEAPSSSPEDGAGDGEFGARSDGGGAGGELGIAGEGEGVSGGGEITSGGRCGDGEGDDSGEFSENAGFAKSRKAKKRVRERVWIIEAIFVKGEI